MATARSTLGNALKPWKPKQAAKVAKIQLIKVLRFSGDARNWPLLSYYSAEGTQARGGRSKILKRTPKSVLINMSRKFQHPRMGAPGVPQTLIPSTIQDITQLKTH